MKKLVTELKPGDKVDTLTGTATVVGRRAHRLVEGYTVLNLKYPSGAVVGLVFGDADAQQMEVVP